MASKLYITKKQAVMQAGNKRRLALRLGISPAYVSQWGRFVPEKQARRVLELWPDIAHREGR